MPGDRLTIDTETLKKTIKGRLVAALQMNGWGNVIELWWRSYNRAAVDEAVVGRAVDAYLDRLAEDLAVALVDGHYPDGTCPHPTEPPA